MAAREELQSLLNRYSYTVDGGDLAGFAGLYAKGEWYAEGTPPNRGVQEVMDNMLSKVILYADGTPRTRHLITNVEFEIDEAAGTAKGQRYVTVLQGTDELPLQVIFSGHYHDEFARENGKWHFTRTVVRHPIVGNMSAHLRSEDFIGGG